VTAAKVDLDAAKAQVTFDPALINAGALCALVAEAGYHAEIVGPDRC
jgi:copper chaperone CopZ